MKWSWVKWTSGEMNVGRKVMRWNNMGWNVMRWKREQCLNVIICSFFVQFFNFYLQKVVISWSIKQFWTNCRFLQMGRIVALNKMERTAAGDELSLFRISDELSSNLRIISVYAPDKNTQFPASIVRESKCHWMVYNKENSTYLETSFRDSNYQIKLSFSLT